MVDNGDRAVGYILGTADTATFVQEYRAKWLPTIEQRYPKPSSALKISAATVTACQLSFIRKAR